MWRPCHQLQVVSTLLLGASCLASYLAIDGAGKLKGVNELSQFVNRRAKTDKGE